MDRWLMITTGKCALLLNKISSPENLHFHISHNEYLFSYLHGIRYAVLQIETPKLWNLSYFSSVFHFKHGVSTKPSKLFIITQVKSYEALNTSIIKIPFFLTALKISRSLEISKVSLNPKMNSKLFNSIFSIWKI